MLFAYKGERPNRESLGYKNWPTANDIFHAEANQTIHIEKMSHPIEFDIKVVGEIVQFSISSRTAPFSQDVIASIQEIFSNTNINVAAGFLPTTPAQLSWEITKKELFEDFSMMDAFVDILLNKVFEFPLSMDYGDLNDRANLRMLLQKRDANYIVQKFIDEKQDKLRKAAGKEVPEYDLAVEISNHLFMQGYLNAYFILGTHFAKKNMFDIAEKLFELVPKSNQNYQKAQENLHFLKSQQIAVASTNDKTSPQELANLLKAGPEKNVLLSIARNISLAVGSDLPDEAVKDSFIEPAEPLDSSNIATAFSVMAIHARQQRKIIDTQAKMIEKLQKQMELYSKKVDELERKLEVKENPSSSTMSFTPYLAAQSVKQQTLVNSDVMQESVKIVANDTEQDASISLSL